jgi:two-component system response regulator (stage 0 sporulation protein F)
VTSRPLPRLLVVDDEIEICDFLKLLFEERGFDVETAYVGVEALAKIESFKPDVILLDIKIPGMDGLEVLKRVKAKHPQIKVLMVTAIETSEKINEALRLGADNYITKPLSLEYLENEVREKLEGLNTPTNDKR